MTSYWRERLRQRIEEINAQGGPPPLGAEIVIAAEDMKVPGHDVFLRHAGRLNDAPFCGAPAGTLEIDFTPLWEQHPQLRFVYRPAPPEGFRPGKQEDHPEADRGDAFGRVTGVGFDELPGPDGSLACATEALATTPRLRTVPRIRLA